jgi:hypothetical protein
VCGAAGRKDAPHGGRNIWRTQLACSTTTATHVSRDRDHRPHVATPGPTGDTDATSARERDRGERRDAWPSPAGSRLGGCRHGGVWLAATFPLAPLSHQDSPARLTPVGGNRIPYRFSYHLRAVVHDNRKPECALKLFETLKAEGAKRR